MMPTDRKAADDAIAYVAENHPDDPRYRWSAHVDGDSVRVVVESAARDRQASFKIAIAELAGACRSVGLVDEVMGGIWAEIEAAEADADAALSRALRDVVGRDRAAFVRVLTRLLVDVGDDLAASDYGGAADRIAAALGST